MIALVFLMVLTDFPVYELDEVVVTATRYPAALRDVALATILIDRQEIEKIHPLSLTEILRHHAGIDIKDYGTSGPVATITMRGIQSNGVLVLIDGHPLNLISAGVADLSAINPHSIEQIEIVKGPVSSLYGANALGGVVNIITTKKYEKPEWHLKISPSTTNSHNWLQAKEIFTTGGLSFNQFFGGLACGYRSSDGYRHNSDLTDLSFQGEFGFDSKQLEIIASILYDDKEYGLPGPKPRVDSMHLVPQFGDSTVTSLFDRQADNVILGDVAVNWQITNKFAWHNKFYADRKLMQYHTTYAGLFNDTITEDFNYLSHTGGLNTMAIFDINDTKIVSGIDVHYDTLKTTKKSYETGDTAWHASSYNIGTWLEGKKNFKTITFAPSVRFDKNARFGNFLSPQLGIIGAFVPTLLIKFSMGKAFRAPTFNDLYWPIYGNPNLKPEHGWAYELRFENSISSNLFASWSIYLRNVKDRIFWFPGADGLWRPQNVNSMKIRGLDIELRSQIADIVTVYLDGSYLNAKQKNNEIVYDFYDWIADTSHTIIKEIERDAAFTPKFMLSTKMNFKLPYESALSLTGLYVGERYNYYTNYSDYPNVSMDTKTLDTYIMVNTVLSKKFSNYLGLSFGVQNLFDIEYSTQFGNSVDDFDYPMPGRIIFAQLTVDY